MHAIRGFVISSLCDHRPKCANVARVVSKASNINPLVRQCELWSRNSLIFATSPLIVHLGDGSGVYQRPSCYHKLNTGPICGT